VPKVQISPGSSVAIIGAGVVGMASACVLNRKGYEVTVFDPYYPGEGGSSKANAGHIGASDIFPLSTPGIHWKALKMLMDSDAPLKVPLKDFWPQIPWFWRFLLTSNENRFKKATDALSYLCYNSIRDTKELLEYSNIAQKLEQNGCAFIYDTKLSFNKSIKSWDERNSRGFSSEVLNSKKIAQITPTINEKFKYAYLSHHWAKVSEPKDIVQGLADSAKMNGVYFRQERVNSVSEKLNSISINAEKGNSKYDAVVIAAGINSVSIAKSLGDFLPITAERGYNLTIPLSNIDIDIPIVFADRGIVATSLESGLRIGGWAEYAHPSRSANPHYFSSIARISQDLFPGLNIENANYWMGSRPSTPDSVPVISRSLKIDRVFYNSGHGHYGLTHAATSANLLCNLMEGEQNLTEIEALSIDRFLN
jgi:D-amino-acid dehydrogenase